jgi:hypothetical protein
MVWEDEATDATQSKAAAPKMILKVRFIGQAPGLFLSSTGTGALV